jgi:phosphoribosyl-ATP pyrophosphohydrolase
MEHKLKILPHHFKAVKSGEKTFELRKNDRGFKVGDTLILQECSITGAYSGDEITKEISYILEGGQYGIEEGYCILGLKATFKSEALKALLDVGLDAKAIQECYERYKWHIDYYKDAIKLKNIDLTRISEEEQWNKIAEENTEFFLALNNKDKANSIEEFWDCMQVRLGMLQIRLGITAEEVMKEYPKHLEKLKYRPRRKEE